MRRVLAVLGAVIMVAAAITTRHALDDSSSQTAPRDGKVVLICADDLLDACRALGAGVVIRSESAAITAAAIAGGGLAADVDGWVTTSAWVEVLASRSPGALAGTEALASSPTVLATAPGRFQAVSDLCRPAEVWPCLGGAAGQPWAKLGDGRHPEWRELKVGLTNPSSAVGLAVLASASAGFFGTRGFTVNDARFADFEGWLATLAEPSAAGDEDPAQTLVTRPGTYSAAGTVAARTGRLRARGVETIAPRPEVAATVVVARLAGRDSLPDVDRIRAALLTAGWSPATPADLAPTLKPGVMAALHSLWRSVTT